MTPAFIEYSAGAAIVSMPVFGRSSAESKFFGVGAAASLRSLKEADRGLSAKHDTALRADNYLWNDHRQPIEVHWQLAPY